MNARRDRNEHRRSRPRLFGMAIVAATALTAMPAALVEAGDKVSVEIEVAVKVEAGADIAAIAERADGWPSGDLIASRGIHVVTVRRDVKQHDDQAKFDKELAKETEQAVKEFEKDDNVRWASEVLDDAAEDDRFHAWPATARDAATASDLTDQPAFADLHLTEVHGKATGNGTIVAVLDTGVDASHPLLAGSVLPGHDLVDDDDNAHDELPATSDGPGAAGHGTFVAGIVLQIAPDAEILPVRVLDTNGRGDLHAVIDGIDYAVERGADVINLSFGLDAEIESKALEAAVKRAQLAGAIVVAAAGNDGNDRKHFPASIDGVVSVTALDAQDGSVPEYATRGKWVTIAAPGHDVVSALPGGGYARWAGTSMASPVVAAGAALVVEAHPDEKSSKRRDMLLKHTQKMIMKDLSQKGRLDLLAALD